VDVVVNAGKRYGNWVPHGDKSPLEGLLLHAIPEVDELPSIWDEQQIVRKQASRVWVGFRRALLEKNPWLNKGINPLGLVNVVRISKKMHFHPHRDGNDGNVTLVFRLKGQSTVSVWSSARTPLSCARNPPPAGSHQWQRLPLQVPGIGYLLAGSAVWHKGRYNDGDMVVIMRAGLTWEEYQTRSGIDLSATHQEVQEQWFSAQQVVLPYFTEIRDHYAVTAQQCALPLSELPWELVVVLWMWPSCRSCAVCDMRVPGNLQEDVVAQDCGAAIWPATMTQANIDSNVDLFARIGGLQCVVTPEVAQQLDNRTVVTLQGLNGQDQIGGLTSLQPLGISYQHFGAWLVEDHCELAQYLPGAHQDSWIRQLAQKALIDSERQLRRLGPAVPQCPSAAVNKTSMQLRGRKRGKCVDVLTGCKRKSADRLQEEIQDIADGLDLVRQGGVWPALTEHSMAFLLQTPPSGIHMDTNGIYRRGWGLIPQKIEWKLDDAFGTLLRCSSDVRKDGLDPETSLLKQVAFKLFMFFPWRREDSRNALFLRWLVTSKWRDDQARGVQLFTDSTASPATDSTINLGSDRTDYSQIGGVYRDFMSTYLPPPFHGTSALPLLTHAQCVELDRLDIMHPHFHGLAGGGAYFIRRSVLHMVINSVHGLNSVAWDEFIQAGAYKEGFAVDWRQESVGQRHRHVKDYKLYDS
jgi:hypothetical protein